MASVPAPAPEAWAPMPYADLPHIDGAALARLWPSLHRHDGIAMPGSWVLAEGWAHYHNGDFARAAAVGLRYGEEGLALANQATAVYAVYLEPREAMRQALLRQVTERAAAQVRAVPDDCSALYWQAWALGHYCHTLNVVRAFALEPVAHIKDALERLLRRQPEHAHAHIALASFHADVINKVGPVVARLTYRVRGAVAAAHYARALELQGDSAHVLVECARGKIMLQGDDGMDEAMELYGRAATLQPADARERLDVELARAALED